MRQRSLYRANDDISRSALDSAAASPPWHCPSGLKMDGEKGKGKRADRWEYQACMHGIASTNQH